MIKIAFIGNCQMVSLCFFTQQLLHDTDIICKWICAYNGFSMFSHQRFSQKCNHKLFSNNESIQYLYECDYIFYQKIKKEKSPLFNEEKIMSYKKYNCISMPSIWLDITTYETSLSELKKREITIKNTMIVTDIITYYYGTYTLFNSPNHPTTFLFLKIMEKIASILHVPFFSNELVSIYLKHDNWMEL